ncbi:hypothetical protein HHI36_003749 [Cryptolaemus montrouzieri]|uniref:Retrotransposon gag domain-containing protein n=1 Tax=Cryptolaemus montrouzieri TaxID=559131 RepID=A0ABD2PEJ8_9CUCU
MASDFRPGHLLVNEWNHELRTRGGITDRIYDDKPTNAAFPLNAPQPQTVSISCSYNFSSNQKGDVIFNGEKNKLVSFYEDIKGYMECRKVSKAELFTSTWDILEGDARYWFRQIKSQVSDWDGLVAALVRHFRLPNHNDDLWDIIKERYQLKSGSVTIYFSKTNTLFGRLSRSPAEVTKVEWFRKLMLPAYRKALPTVETDSITQLYNIVRKLEDEDYLEIDSPGTSKIAHKTNFLEPEPLGSSSEISFHFKDKNIDKFHKNSSDWKHKYDNPTVSAIEATNLSQIMFVVGIVVR